jgi:NAD(P)-dependent dehydrogenase (short-subunit alcohol dehydrogenase family)
VDLRQVELHVNKVANMNERRRVALVTGAGRSVGAGIARALAAGGAAVAVNDLHPDRANDTVDAIRGSGGEAIAVPFDATDRVAIDAALAKITETLGPVGILVNNAGIVEGMGTSPFLDSDPSTWRPTFELNLFGAMHCIQAVAPGMVDLGWGRIIQISSGASSVGLRIGVSLYGAAKAGIEGLIRHLAVELGRTGVTCNTLALGLMESTGERVPSAMLGRLFSGVPVGRLGLDDEIGAAALWLASDSAAFVTGQVIHLNGGSSFGR